MGLLLDPVCTSGGREAVREAVDPSLRDLVDELPDGDARHTITYAGPGIGLQGRRVDVLCTAVRIRDAGRLLAGTATFMKPAAGMGVLGALAGVGDLQHFERMQRVVRPARRPAAILFADLEGSSPLARRLSTASFFGLSRRLVRAIDGCIIDAGGIVGRHVADGVVAFFLAEVVGGESAAARAAITAARAVRVEALQVAERSGLAAEDVVLRFGLHWGSTLYVGQMATRGRAEVTAMGDEVNETSRIEACATGGRALASKVLVERLDAADAAALGLDPARMSYVRLSDLQTANEKARRDAPAIAVCDV